MSHDQSITPEDLHQWVRYDPETGELFWKVDRGGVRAGSVAGTLRSDGYIRVQVNGKLLRAHRVAWAIYHGRWPEMELDHINGDRADNRIANLRDVPHPDNHKNVKKQSNNTSGVAGVHWDADRERWAAEIGGHRSGTYRHLGRFEDFEDAVAARKAAEAEGGYSPIHGEDAAVRWLLG